VTADLLIGIGAVIAVVVALLWWTRTREFKRERADFRATSRHPAPSDAKTKRRLDTALRELRELREALPPSDQVRVERRKTNSPPPGAIERRTERPRKGNRPR
jgi:hypothetical protein